jgi:hypothetical protein
MNILVFIVIFIKIGSAILLFKCFDNDGLLEKCITNVSYNSIYYYSKIQLGFIKGKKLLNNLVKSTPILNNTVNNFINTKIHNKFEVITGDTRCFYWNDNELLNDAQKENIIGANYDFIIYSDNSKSCVNSIIFNNFENIPKQRPITYEEADYKFIMTEIIYDDVKISINLRAADYNFLIVNNKLDNIFIQYFLKKYHNISNFNSNNYIIKIIDHNVNIIEFDSTKALVINKSNYVLEDTNKIDNIDNIVN